MRRAAERLFGVLHPAQQRVASQALPLCCLPLRLENVGAGRIGEHCKGSSSRSRRASGQGQAASAPCKAGSAVDIFGDGADPRFVSSEALLRP